MRFGNVLFILLAIFSSTTEAQVVERTFIHYTNNHGLPYSAISDILQDDEGFMWIATRMSVCRFDGYEFMDVKVFDYKNDQTYIRTPRLLKDSDGALYLMTSDSRFYKYHPGLNIFRECKVNLRSYRQTSIVPSASEGFLILKEDRIDYIPPGADTIIMDNGLKPINDVLKNNISAASFAVKGEHIYLVTNNNSLISFNTYSDSISIEDLNLDDLVTISEITIDASDRLWLKDPSVGIWCFDPRSKEMIRFSSSETDENRRIPHNMVRGIVEDKQGNIWIGTENGLAIWNTKEDDLEIQQYDERNPNGLNSNAIYVIYPDRKGDMWIGTYFGGINIWNSETEFFNILTSGFDDNRLSGKEVRSIFEDIYGNIWIGLEGAGANRLDIKTGEIQHFRHKAGVNSLSYDNVHSFACDSVGKIYIGTYTGGLNIFDPISGRFSYKNTTNSPLQSDMIYSLVLIGDSLFLGTELGLSVMDIRTGLISHFIPEIFNGKMVELLYYQNGKIWISTRSDLYCYDIYRGNVEMVPYSDERTAISFITSDSFGTIWIGDSYNGLFRFDPETSITTHFKPNSSLPASRILGILEGNAGWYWISSSNGLIRFKPETGDYIHYTIGSGLPFSQFNFNAFFKDSRNYFYFGGINGLIYFNDLKEIEFRMPDNVVFSRIQLSGSNIEPGNSNVIKGALNINRQLVLSHRQNNFSIFYSGLNFVHPGRTQYAYILDGLNQDWSFVGNNTSATYTNLSPGTYYFRVKSGNENYEWSDDESVMKIIVKPPLWRTAFAFVIYGILFLGALLVFYLVTVRVEKANALALLERREKEHQQRLNLLKAEFFTNIAHELRTPLTLIIGPLVNLLKSNKVDEAFWDKLRNINENARRLLSLINQLLEFRRVESGKELLNVSEGEVKPFIGDIADAFSDLAEIRNIDFQTITEASGPVWFDHYKIERVIFNLLANAFNYTNDGEKIRLKVSFIETNTDSHERYLRFEVEDTGKGIPKESIENIFTEYTRDAKKRHHSSGSSGIGLHFAKSLVTLHKGEIWVNSREGDGSSFVFTIPCNEESYSTDEKNKTECGFVTAADEMVRLEMSHPGHQLPEEFKESNPTIMVVEDDENLLSFIVECLRDGFNVIPEKDALSALKRVAGENVDLVVSDIIMPGMDGIELTTRLKTDIATSHIPVILLSSRTLPDEKIEGLSSGADFYIEKPFYPQILVKHIENILRTRKKLIEQFQKDISLAPAEIAYTRADKEFIDEITSVIMANLDNPVLDVSFLLSKLHISRTLLHLKLKKIAQCSATGFIRTIRLREAARLISEEGRSISEAAWLSGFSSPAFFSRRFKEYFGQSPKDYFRK
jgi:signal transduction histidine kinase/ligand-binding sensor domain-containing protein/CheY-like chemotaxis protein